MYSALQTQNDSSRGIHGISNKSDVTFAISDIYARGVGWSQSAADATEHSLDWFLASNPVKLDDLSTFIWSIWHEDDPRCEPGHLQNWLRMQHQSNLWKLYLSRIRQQTRDHLYRQSRQILYQTTIPWYRDLPVYRVEQWHAPSMARRQLKQILIFKH